MSVLGLTFVDIDGQSLAFFYNIILNKNTIR
jgi:hypothetical protein